MLWPSLINATLFCSIRDVIAEVGVVVVHAAVAEKQAEGHGDLGFKESKVWKILITY